MSEINADVLVIIGRILLGALYVVTGAKRIMIREGATASMRNRGVPMAPAAFAIGTIIQIGCGLLLMLGLFVRPAAFGLAAFTIAASIIALNFWDKQGEARTANVNSWQTNLAIIGGLLLAAATSL